MGIGGYHSPAVSSHLVILDYSLELSIGRSGGFCAGVSIEEGSLLCPSIWPPMSGENIGIRFEDFFLDIV